MDFTWNIFYNFRQMSRELFWPHSKLSSQKFTDPNSLYSCLLRNLLLLILFHFHLSPLLLFSLFLSSPLLFFFFSENHPLYMGTYWAGLSSPHAGSVVENSDLMIFAGAVLNDYTTVGWTALINCKTSIEMFPRKVVVCGKLYINVMLSDLLGALSAKAPKKEVLPTDLLLKQPI